MEKVLRNFTLDFFAKGKYKTNPDKLNDIQKEKPIAVFSPGGNRVAIVYAYLSSKCFTDVSILDGGYAALVDAFKLDKVLKALEMNNKYKNI